MSSGQFVIFHLNLIRVFKRQSAVNCEKMRQKNLFVYTDKWHRKCYILGRLLESLETDDLLFIE
jgi:hypothetical protein